MEARADPLNELKPYIIDVLPIQFQAKHVPPVKRIPRQSRRPHDDVLSSIIRVLCRFMSTSTRRSDSIHYSPYLKD